MCENPFERVEISRTIRLIADWNRIRDCISHFDKMRLLALLSGELAIESPGEDSQSFIVRTDIDSERSDTESDVDVLSDF